MPESHDNALESLVGQIADEFTRRHQSGEKPAIEEYTRKHPEIADLLREILPAIQAMSPTSMAAGGSETIDHVRAGPAPPTKKRTICPGDSLGPYELLAPLGSGGMGQVFKARHRTLDRIVALKIIRPDCLVGPQAVARFHQEAKTAARLSHPNVVVLYETGEDQGTHYLAMQLIEGTTLHNLIQKRGPLPIATACDYARQTALALEHARQHGLVHRDIKPANLLLTRTTPGESATIKVLDFGLARFTSESGESDHLTSEGMILGTPDFIAPEQAEDSQTADIRADIFSLGCTLFYLLTGDVPYAGTNVMEKLTARVRGTARPVRALRSETPAGLARVLAKAMARLPEDRYPTPAAFAAALEPFCVGASEAAHAGKPASRTRLPYVLAAVAVGVFLVPALVIGAAVGVLGLWPKHPPDDPDRLVLVPIPAKDKQPGDSSKDKTQRPKPIDIKDDTPTKEKKAQKEITPVKPPPDKPNPKSRIVVPSPKLEPRKLDDGAQILGEGLGRHWGAPYVVAVSPDGQRFATAGTLPVGGFCALWDAPMRDYQPLPFPDAGELSTVQAMAFSADGKKLAASAGSRTWVWDVSVQPPTVIFDAGRIAGAWIRFADADTLLVGGHGKLYTFDVRSTKAVKPAESGKYLQGASKYIYVRGGSAVIYLDPRTKTIREISVVDPSQDRELIALDPSFTVMSMTATDNGQLVALGGPVVQVYDVSKERARELTGNLPERLDDPEIVVALAFSGDGARLASGTWGGTVRCWNVEPAKVKLASGDYVHGAKVHALAFAADGVLLASVGADHALRLWDTSLPPPTDADPNPSGATRVVAYSPDGKMLLSGHGSEWWPVPGSLHWWESDSGRRIRSIHGPWLPTSVYVTGDAKSPRAIVAGVEQARRNQSRSMITSWNWGEGGLAPAANHLNLDPASVQENVNLASCNDWFLVYGSRPSLSARPRVYLFDGVGPAQKANFVLPGGTCVAAFSPDGRWLAVSGHIDNTIKPMKGVPIDRRIPIRLYETATLVGLTVPETMKNGPPKEIRQIGESTTNVSALAFTTDSKGVIVADAVGRLRLLDIAGGKPVELQGAATPSKALSLLTLSADGQLLAGCGRNGHVFVMNLATKRTVLSRHLPGPVYGVAFSPAADQLALAAGNGSTWILPLRK